MTYEECKLRGVGVNCPYRRKRVVDHESKVYAMCWKCGFNEEEAKRRELKGRRVEEAVFKKSGDEWVQVGKIERLVYPIADTPLEFAFCDEREF